MRKQNRDTSISCNSHLKLFSDFVGSKEHIFLRQYIVKNFKY